MAATDTTTATTRALVKPLQTRTMWEVDLDHPERGIRRVQAELYASRVDEEERARRRAEGEIVADYQWEVETSGAIYPARFDGAFIEDYDSGTRIFITIADAARFCAERLRARIAADTCALAAIEKRVAVKSE